MNNSTEELKNSNDCISRAEAIAVHDPLFEAHAIERIKKLPSVQPEIVRCKKCKHYEWMGNRIPDEQTWHCCYWNADTGKDDFCSFAERRTDE